MLYIACNISQVLIFRLFNKFLDSGLKLTGSIYRNRRQKIVSDQ